MSLKRHLVMDLYHADQTETVNDSWNDVLQILPNLNRCKVKVRTSNGNETFAYYYYDLSSFWDCTTKETIDNVTHWISLKE